MNVGYRIKKRRKELGINADRLADILGVSRSTVFRYENGDIEKLPITILDPIATALNTTPAYLMGWEDSQDNIESFDEVNFAAFKVIGSIAAGYGMEAVEEYTGELEYLPYSMLRGRSPSDYFVLRVKGNSMYPQLIEGDKVLVLRSTSVDSGSIAVVMYNGTEATLKKVNYVYGEDWMELVPINPEYPPKRVEGAALEECRVLGKVVTLIRNM